jgi:hypothetical protein
LLIACVEPGATAQTGAAVRVVNVSRLPESQDETAVTIDPANNGRAFVAANIGPFLRPAGTAAGLMAAFSTDGGQSWTPSSSSVAGSPPPACCDPSARFDRFGNLFLSYVASDLRTMVVLLSTDGGRTFGALAAHSANGAVDQPSIDTGPDGTGAGSIWISWREAGHVVATGARVAGLGASQVQGFSTLFNVPGPGGGEGFGDVAVGPGGQVVVVYQDEATQNCDGLRSTIFSSTDPDGLGPQAFRPPVTVSSTNVCGGDSIPAQPRRSVDAEANLAWDRRGQGAGRVYVVYTDETPDESADLDVFVRVSDDAGATWSVPARVSDDGSRRSQFQSAINVDPASGAAGVCFLDARLDAGSGADDRDGVQNTDVQPFCSISTNGGGAWSPNIRVGAGPTGVTPLGGQQLGDYINVAFNAGVLMPAWPDDSNSTGDNPDARNALETYVARVTFSSASPTPPSGSECPGHAGDARPDVVGTAGDDVLSSSAGGIVCALGGNDVLRAAPGGGTLLEGGDGLDVLCARQNASGDQLDGGPGIDRGRFDSGEPAAGLERFAPQAFCAG